jgi:hypothetical protein
MRVSLYSQAAGLSDFCNRATINLMPVRTLPEIIGGYCIEAKRNGPNTPAVNIYIPLPSTAQNIEHTHSLPYCCCLQQPLFFPALLTASVSQRLTQDVCKHPALSLCGLASTPPAIFIISSARAHSSLAVSAAFSNAACPSRHSPSSFLTAASDPL